MIVSIDRDLLEADLTDVAVVAPAEFLMRIGPAHS